MMFRAIFLAALASVMALGAAAHPQRVAVADIILNERSGYIEVAHRFSLHDAEHALIETGNENADLLGDPATQEAFANYVARHFALAGADGEEIALSLLGWEIDDGAIWVYEQAPLDGPMERLTVSHDALREIWPDQQTLVSIYQGTARKSLLFRGRDGAKTVGF